MKRKIPDFQTSSEGPSLSASQHAIAAASEEMRHGVTRSIQHSFSVLAETAKEYEKAQEHKRDVQRETQLGELMLSHEKDFLQFQKEYDQESHDPNEYTKDMERQFDKIQGEQIKDVKDPTLRDMFTIRMNRRKYEVINHAFTEENQRWLDGQKASRIKQIEELHQLGITANSPQAAAEYRSGILSIIEASSGNILKRAEAEAAKIKYGDQFDKDRQRVVVSRIEADIADNPYAAHSGLLIGGYQELTDEPTRQHLTKVAKEAGRVQTERTRIENERKEKDELETQRMEALDLLVRGKLTYGEIAKRTTLNKHEGYTWLERSRERSERKPNVQTNFRVYARILDSVGEKDKYEIINDLEKEVNRTISENDAEKLLGYALSYEKSDKTEWMRNGRELMKSMIFGGGSPDLVKPIEWEDYARAEADLRKLVSDAEKSKKPLRGQEILEKAGEIAKGYQKTPKDKMKLARERRKGKPSLTPEVSNKMDQDAGLSVSMP